MHRTLLIVFLMLMAAVPAAYTQTDKLPDKLPDELNQAQWEFVRDMYAIDAILLLAKLDTLALEIDSLRKLNEYTENFDCEAELYAIVGASKEQVADYRLKLQEAESMLSNNIAPGDAERNIVAGLYSSKIKCLPEFSERVAALYVKMTAVKQTELPVTGEDMYTVAYGDVLTGISLKFYGTVNKWNFIWEANRTEIDDPNFIYPGQLIKIPKK
ncbi:MAG: LysM peptidoglycan-binding domain-containing protein [Ignavibacteria bacterium]|nr:LysM peptidoglycan-binding domain-containing protein [Ignavibacteria bacterium]